MLFFSSKNFNYEFHKSVAYDYEVSAHTVVVLTIFLVLIHFI